MQFIDLKKQYQLSEENIKARIRSVLEHGEYVFGPEVFELEDQLSKYVGVKHTISCANGTDALSLALMAMNIGPGDVVFLPTFTFFATGEAVVHAGATPVFVDSDPETFNMCPKSLRTKIEQLKFLGDLNPKAIIAVDLFGLPADYKTIQKLADDHSLLLIEDAAQGFGGRIGQAEGEKRAGSFGAISTTSIFPAKPLGCYGDGGAVFTDDDSYADLLRSYRVHGKGKDKYDNVRIGINSRLDTIQAAILLEKLAIFDNELVQRNHSADRYRSFLKDLLGIQLPYCPPGTTSSWAQFTVRFESEAARQAARKVLADQGIPSQIYYPKCLHRQPALIDKDPTEPKLPIAEALSKTVLSLPMHPYLENEDQRTICSFIRDSLVHVE